MKLIDLVKRYEGNPIITTNDIHGSYAVFNAGAIKYGNRQILLVSVCMAGSSGVGRNIHVAESYDGINFTIRQEPFIEAGTDGPFTQFDYDICDPRIVELEGKIYITYPAHLPGVGIVGVLGTTEDFETFTRLEYISLPHNRVPIFFPEKINKPLLYLMSKVDPSKIKICGIKTVPYISLETPTNDAELTGCVELLKIYIQKSNEIEQIFVAVYATIYLISYRKDF